MTVYDWVKAAHIISVVAWMAGLLYLPRLFVYHSDASPGGEHSETLKIMERRLLRGIMNPAMILTFVFGIWMLVLQEWWTAPWMWAKLALIVVLTVFHHLLGMWRKDFEADRNTKPAKFYRFVNEVPTLCLIGIVLLVVLKPF